MKFIHLADLHIGRLLANHSLLEDQRHVLDQVLAFCEEAAPQAVLLAGDLFDRSVPREEAVALYDDFIAKLVLDMAIPVYAITGNHDSPVRMEGMSDLLARAGYGIQGSLRSPLIPVVLRDEFGPVHLYLLPYSDPRNARAIFDLPLGLGPSQILESILAQASLDPHRKILMSHNYYAKNGLTLEESESERRVNIGGEEVLDSRILETFDYVALGHLHKAQKVGLDKVRYAGSLLKYSASEVDHQKSFPFVTMDEAGRCRIDLIPVSPLRDLRAVSGFFQEFLKRDFIENKEDFLVVNLKDPDRVDNAWQRLSQLYPNIIALNYPNLIGAEEIKVDAQAIRQADLGKLYGDFFREKKGRELTEEEARFMQGIFREMEAQDESN